MPAAAPTKRVFVVCGRGAESTALERYFSNAFGPVTKVKSDAQKGIAWVTFSNESDAQKAVTAFQEEKYLTTATETTTKGTEGDGVEKQDLASASSSLVDLNDGFPKRHFTVVFSEEMRKRERHQQQPSATTVTTTTLTTTTTTTTTTSSMQFTNNNQMNELPEGSRLFLVTPKDCTDDVLNKAVLSVLENEEFKLEPEDLVKVKILGITSGGEDEEEEEQSEEVQNESKNGKNTAALEYARVGKGNKGVAFVKFTTKSAAEKFAKFVHVKLHNVLGDMKVKIMTAEKKKYTKNSSQYHQQQHNNTNSKNSLNTFSGGGVGGALSSGVFSENGNNEQGEISSQHRRGYLPKSNAVGEGGNVVVIGEATVGEVKGTLVFHPKVGVSDAIQRRFPTPPPLPKGLPPPQQRMQQMNIESSNTAGMAMRRPREYGDEETKARSKGTKVSKVEPKTPCDQNQLIDEDDRNETKDEHINETDNIAAEAAVTAMGLVTIKDGENTSTMGSFASVGTKASVHLNEATAKRKSTVLYFETKLPLPVYVLSHALKSRGLENNNVSSRIVPQFEVKATSALSGIVEEVVSTSSSPSFSSKTFFDKFKGTFDICGVECCVYEKDAVETAKEQVQEEKTDVVRPAVDESITEHERKRSRVETR